MSIIIATVMLSTLQSALFLGGVATLGAFVLPPMYRFTKSKLSGFKLPEVLGRGKRQESVAS